MKECLRFKPLLMIELLIVALLIGVGTAFAMNVNPLPTDRSPWAGQTTITEAPDLEVTNWYLEYTTGLGNVSTLNVEVHNKDLAGSHNGTLRIALGDSSPTTTLAWGSKGTGNIAADGTALISFDLDTEANATVDPDIADVDWLNIIIEEM